MHTAKQRQTERHRQRDRQIETQRGTGRQTDRDRAIKCIYMTDPVSSFDQDNVGLGSPWPTHVRATKGVLCNDVTLGLAVTDRGTASNKKTMEEGE